MKKILSAISLCAAAHVAYAGTADAPAASQATGNALLMQIQATNLEILATLKGMAAKQSQLAQPGDDPAVIYSLSGETQQPWAPDGVWSDKKGTTHVRFKTMGPLSHFPDIYAMGPDGSYAHVGLTFWPTGIVDLETNAHHILFKLGSSEVRATAVER